MVSGSCLPVDAIVEYFTGKVKLYFVIVLVRNTNSLEGGKTMETARCRAFLAAAETGSFSRAAEMLRYTPSGTSLSR